MVRMCAAIAFGTWSLVALAGSCRTCSKVSTCFLSPRSWACRISSTIMSRTFSLPWSCDRRYSASAVEAISGRCSCSAMASTSSSVKPHNAMQSSSVIML